MTGSTEVVLRSETLEASFLPELGARIHRLRAFGHDLLRTPDDLAAHRADPFFWGAYPMAPWCNRASAGRTTVAGRTVELQPNFSDGTAIHGLVAAVPWERGDDGSFELMRRADGSWPWTFAVRLVIMLRDADLTLRWTLANLDDAPMPAGLGLHPWFRRPVELRVLASAVYASNVASSVEPQPVEGATDLRSLAPPAIGLDGTWTALDEPAIELAWPPLGVRARLEARSSAGRTLVALATPADVEAIAVEPQTHGPNPLRRLAAGEPDAPVLLDPGSELGLELGLHFGLARSEHA
jgi:aldose 1-epimerase